ncbi:MAG TPA: VOC family protein [Candidatus Binataceae bacterium]|nr:VOC family protein [Candidatus Binataceae bacterium]
MLQPKQLGYLALDVANLESSLRFYQDVAHFEVTEEREGAVYLTGGIQHHWLVLKQSQSPGVNRVAFEMANPADLEAIEKRLRGAGVEVERGGSLARERVDQYIRFRDPDGIMIELFTDMVTMPMPPTYAHRVHMSKLLHTVLLEKDINKSVPFYTDLLGFQISDWVERSAAFMRCGDHYHHSLGVFGTGGTRTSVDHVCILVPTLDDLMRARANVMALGIPFRNDLLKHAPSGSIAIYLRDEANNLVVEFCWEHGQILDDTHRPRVLPAMPETLDMWRLVGPSHGKGLPSRADMFQGGDTPPQIGGDGGQAHPMTENGALDSLGVRLSDGAQLAKSK